MPTPYPHTLRWRTAVEPAALAAALARTADGPYLTYEDDGRVAVAEGEHAAVTLTAAGLAVDGGPPGPVTGSPLAA
ncbi:MAG TPA: hypothetical protein VFY17_10000, partial [Pilimelia sp.]|nr:hypothetical protein [Pilimelia sp.]